MAKEWNWLETELHENGGSVFSSQSWSNLPENVCLLLSFLKEVLKGTSPTKGAVHHLSISRDIELSV